MNKLKNKNIVITRPQPSATRLAKTCQEHGANAIIFPTIEIVPYDLDENLLNDLIELQQADKIIFTSANAVSQCVKLFKENTLSIPTQAQFFAVGQSTAQLLHQQWQCHVYSPMQSFSSETLLEHPFLQNVQNQTIVIVSGKGGREYLQETLQQRGAKVNKICLYERICATIDPKPLFDAWQTHGIDCIVCTSVEGLQNLFTIVGEHGKRYLHRTLLVVISDRMLEYAETLGYSLSFIVKASSAQDKEILSALSIQWKQ